MRITKGRAIMVWLIVQTLVVMYMFAAYYAPMRYPAINEAFELGNWLMGLFIGGMSSTICLAIGFAWDTFGEE